MADYIKKYNNIRICAHAFYASGMASSLKGCTHISLKFAVPCADGIWRTITTNTYETDITYARIFTNDTIKATEKVVESIDELTEFFNSFKPADAPSIVLNVTDNSFARWVNVSPKGTIRVYRHTVATSFSTDIPLPQDGEVIGDASPSWQGSMYNCNVYWNSADAMKALWGKALSDLDRLKKFCRIEKEKDDKELAVGATRIDALLKFQESAKSIETQIADKWNAMSTEDKAKVLNLTKKPVTPKSKSKTKTKKK